MNRHSSNDIEYRMARFRFSDGWCVITAVVLRNVSDIFLFRTIILELTDTIKVALMSVLYTIGGYRYYTCICGMMVH